MKNFLKRILNTETKRRIFDGMIAYLLVILATFLFIELTEFIIKKGTNPIEKNFLLWLHSLSNPLVNKIMLFITELGGLYFIVFFTLFLVFYQYYRQKIKNTLFIGISVIGTIFLNTLLKVFIQRPRPQLWEQLISEKFFSFPSGHAMISMSLALVIIFVFWKSRFRKLMTCISLIYAFLVAFSRMYLGVHYPTDILGGWIISFAWVILMHRIIFTEEDDLVDLISD